jgi:sugar lactone lactonase YvrE
MRGTNLSIHRQTLSSILVVVGLTAFAFGEGTRTWEQSKFDELSKGTTKGVAVRSTGGLQLAPAFKQLYTTPSTYIWSIAADDSGILYAATGAPARLYRITPEGQASTIFEPQELQVQALVVNKKGAIYAATSPDGKVYKIEQKKNTPARGEKGKAEPGPAWTSSVYFDPGTKYIWDLAIDNQDNLYIATGDHGEIYRVTPKGEHAVFFKSDEAHIRVLALDPKGNLIAGSDGSGLVYRIAPTGQAFVLYSAPKKEITALAIDDAGNIYAAGAGEKRAGGPSSAVPAGTAVNAPMGGMQSQPIGGPTIPAGPIAFPAPGLGATGGSEVYRIAPDGSPLRIWTSANDLVYALAFDERGNLLAGTGNRGHIFSITGQDEFIDLIKAGATQVTAFAKAAGGGLYASTSNLGKVFLIGPALTSEGTYDSDIFDAHIFSRWGRSQFRGVGNVQLFARSGNVDNPDRNWSSWQPVDFSKDAALNVPSARFIQWRAVLRAGNPAPRVDSVVINYLPKNVAPQIDDVTMLVGMRYPQVLKPVNVDPAITMPPPAPMRDHDAISVKWSAHDDNDDQLAYSIYYRGDGESRWLLLKEGISEKFYSFDAGLLPDGGYIIKVVASDAPSHSPGDALTSDKESGRFEVDTTPPQIESLTAAMQGGQIHVTFHATDTFSPIKRAEYSVDAGDWQFIEPVDQISDNKAENYRFQIKLPDSDGDSVLQQASSGTRKSANSGADDPEHVVVVRAYDRFDNMGTAKVLVRGR